IATLNKKPIRKLKIVTLDKYHRSRTKLRTFLTNINLYCRYNDVPNNKKKILIANTYIKGKVAS
ncbi:hypothetical protein COCSADRAFT_78478, partial [Bipolaris sorokiniana ND90Pr]